MTADIEPGHGLGWVESPEDSRDFPMSAAYDALGIDVPDALPASYRVPGPYAPILDQGSSPMCVAYSSDGEQVWFDLRDSGPVVLDPAMFFKWIGGTAQGAIVRDALKVRLSTGYPPKGHADQAGRHRIAAYYSVPVTQQDLCAAILSFGPVVIGSPWYKSWFAPSAAGDLPAPDVKVGGHAFLLDGWDRFGLWGVNSWGEGWGVGGRFRIPWSRVHYLREAWKAVDSVTPRPTLPLYRVVIDGNSRTRVTDVLASMGGAKVGELYRATVTARLKDDAHGTHWYRIETARGDAAKYVGKWFAAHSWMTATPVKETP